MEERPFFVILVDSPQAGIGYVYISRCVLSHCRRQDKFAGTCPLSSDSFYERSLLIENEGLTAPSIKKYEIAVGINDNCPEAADVQILRGDVDLLFFFKKIVKRDLVLPGQRGKGKYLG